MSEFNRKAEAAAGMSWDEIQWWAEREEFERQQYAKERGHCCWAGGVASPDPCPWHYPAGEEATG